MTVSLKHTFQSAKTDSLDVTLVQPSNWNQEHVLTAAAGKVLGRDTSGAGNVQELPISVTAAGNVTIPNNFAVTGTSGLTGNTTVTGTLGVTGTTTLTNLNATGTVGFTNALAVTSGGTGLATLTANNVLIGNGTSPVTAVAPGAIGNLLTSNGTAWASSPAPATGVNFPQNIQSADYTLVIGDAGKQIFHPASDTASRTYTIPANASVAFLIGTVILFTAENTAKPVTVSITSDTLVFGSGTTGSVAVAPNNTLMAIKVTATKWMANYLYQTGRSNQIGQTIAVAHLTTPFVTAYPWTTASGFGAKYTNPTTVPASNSCVTFNNLGNIILLGYSAYPWSSAGFGTKYADPATLPAGFIYSSTFNPTGDTIAVGHGTTPFISVYPWTTASGFGTKYADPATLPPNYCAGVAFNPAGTALAVVHPNSPYISVYPWSGAGFGTKFANPATLPPNNGAGVTFSPAGDAIALAHISSPFISAYPWSGAGFGTKYANPGTLPTQNGNGVAFSPAGNAIALAHNGSPYMAAYAWSVAGFGTKYASPATIPGFDSNGVAFNAAGDTVAFANESSATAYVIAYPWSAGGGFGTAYSNPSTIPTGDGYGVAFTTGA